MIGLVLLILAQVSYALGGVLIKKYTILYWLLVSWLLLVD